MSLTVSLIAAMSTNRVIGSGDEIPWKIPGEQKIFRDLTLDHAIVMGRKTYETIGKPLPKRTNIVVTTRENYEAPGCIVVNTLEEAIARGRESNDEVFIAGGANIYAQSLPICHKIYLTTILKDYEGDAFFPVFSDEDFVEKENRYIQAEPPYTFSVFERVPKM
jgi:dihydrofolate reductase (trimethoprim resistance protein)